MHRKIKKSFRITMSASHSMQTGSYSIVPALQSFLATFLSPGLALYSMQTVSYPAAPALYSVFFKIDPAVKDLYTVLAKPLGLRPRAAERKFP